MQLKSLKLLIGFGISALAVSSVPACGGDDEGGGGKAGSGGKDAGPDTGTGASGGSGGSGGTGGSGGSGGATGGSGGSDGGVTITCASETCKSYNVVITTLNPCCAGTAKDKCGVDIDSTISGTLGIAEGCYELNQAGNLDTSCPDLTGVPVINKLPGCCNAATSKCSILVDVTALGGPNMGCLDPANAPASDAGPPKSCTPGQPGDGGSDATTEAGDAAGDVASDSPSDAAGDAPSDASGGG